MYNIRDTSNRKDEKKVTKKDTKQTSIVKVMMKSLVAAFLVGGAIFMFYMRN